MARPKVKEPKQQYTVMLKPSTVKQIDALAQKIELSRSQFMSNLIEMGLDDAKMLDRFGMLSAVTGGKKVISHLKNMIVKGSLKAETNK